MLVDVNAGIAVLVGSTVGGVEVGTAVLVGSTDVEVEVAVVAGSPVLVAMAVGVGLIVSALM